jgi:hypothetical protein
MSMIDRLLGQLRQRGLEVAAGEKPGELVLRGPAKERTPELMKALKAFRPQLLARFGKTETVNGEPAPARQAEPKAEPEPEPEPCRQCGRDVRDPEDRERLTGINPFCAEVGCPFRRRC